MSQAGGHDAHHVAVIAHTPLIRHDRLRVVAVVAVRCTADSALAGPLDLFFVCLRHGQSCFFAVHSSSSLALRMARRAAWRGVTPSAYQSANRQSGRSWTLQPTSASTCSSTASIHASNVCFIGCSPWGSRRGRRRPLGQVGYFPLPFLLRLSPIAASSASVNVASFAATASLVTGAL